MSAPSSKKPAQTPSQQNANVTNNQKAQLNAMGILLYEPVKQISLVDQPWIKDVCELLKIPVENCVFDSSKPTFDFKTQTLHLPATSYAKLPDVKKSVWLSIRQFVS